MSSDNKQYDIAIIGGGMVGLSTLIALKPLIETGAKIVIIDPAKLPNDVDSLDSPSFDDRATALSLASSQFLKKIGVWSFISPFAQPILDIEVSSYAQIGFTQLNHKQAGTQAFGFIVSNKHIGQALLQACKTIDNVDYIYAQHVSELNKTHASDFPYESILSNGQRLKARLTLLTDGGRSQLKQILKFKDEHFDYEKVAVVSNVQTKYPHNGKAFERFDQHGPIALLPFHQENVSALVWTMPADQLDDFLVLNDSQQLTLLNQRFGNRLGHIQKIGKLAHYPLRLSMCKEQVRPGLILLGNSACALHPVAGQGFNLALFAVKELSKRLNNQSIHTINHLTILMDYQHSVWPRQKIMSQFSHQMVQSFESTNPFIQYGRSFLLSTLEAHPIAKGVFSRFAMGL
ncbi:MAG: FAD-dependent monooxygenase [Saccharospirillaceae bacterium]|nr:FAD-dependent monooxygenase [Pseudomonadales bacterium]NRB81633.1 FAD-dependent monooxygenase [Saccharospirillaceae bacterium]